MNAASRGCLIHCSSKAHGSPARPCETASRRERKRWCNSSGLQTRAGERMTDRQIVGQRRKFFDARPQPGKILVHVATEAIGHFIRKLWIFVGQLAEAEIRFVKRIDELAH